MGEKGGSVVRNMYKGYMDKARGAGSRVGSGVRKSGRHKMETTVLEQQ